MSSSSNSSPSRPGCLDSQCFHHVFPAALPHCQRNIFYAAVLQQPSLVANLEHQSSYEEDDSIQSLIHVFHHLCLTQIYLGSFELHTNHITSSTLHMAATLDDILDLLRDHGFHHHVLSLPPNNITLSRVFRPIYCTLTTVERDAYEESDLRLVNHILSPPPILPILAPRAPSPTSSLETPASSLLLTTTTLLDTSADPCPAFQQGCATSYPTHVAPQDRVWAQNPQRLLRLFVFTVTLQGIFTLTAWSMSVPIVASVPPATPNIIALKTTVLFATSSATLPATVQTASVPSAMTQVMSLWIVPSPKTLVVVSSSTMEGL